MVSLFVFGSYLTPRQSSDLVLAPGWVQFDMMNHYQVQVGEGMDALLVLACVCCIDEEFDEEHQKRKEERQRKD